MSKEQKETGWPYIRREIKTAEDLADAIIEAADGYHNGAQTGYPPYALMSWDDRLRWSAFIKKVAALVIKRAGLLPGKADA